MSFIEKIVTFIPWLWVIIVIVVIWAWFYIDKQKKNSKLSAKRQIIEMIPSAVSTLGVLGTFLGITVGLLCFNPAKISESIPKLLDGLKTAFFTSLAGMIGSLILSRKINKLFDEETGGVSDINQAASLICKSVAELQSESVKQAQAQAVFNNLIQTVIQKMDAGIDTLNANISALNTATNSMALHIQNIKSSTENIDNATNSMLTSVGNMEETTKTTAAFTKDIYSNVGEITDHTEAMVSTEEEVSGKITSLADKLHGEVLDIEDKMKGTNSLLEHKFDEFSELLKKNNTEALVEVMKRVTEEFQSQMNALISKLVQENFEQLNKSVEQLNTWQIENKEMIASLTKQYRQMADNFDATSTTLTKVGGDTKMLVSDGGKLRQIIDALNKVLIEDTKFIEVSTKLADTATLTKDNMEKFDESTNKLNEWVKKQRNFVDGVNLLINKLDEISKIKDYSEVFWKDTKTGLNDAVSMIRGSIDSLNKEIGEIDEHFYERLNATLSELDRCIQAMIQGRR